MRSTTFLIVLLGALVAFAAADAAAGEFTPGHVVVLSDDTFDEFIAAHEHVLVEFYAPWCGHCKNLAPEYEQAAAALEEDDIVLAKVDATEETDLANRFEIKGFPTLIMFNSGVRMPYTGGRDAEGIVGWVRSHTGPAFETLTTADEIAAFRKANPVHVIGWFAGFGAGAEEGATPVHAAGSAKLAELMLSEAVGDVSLAFVGDEALFSEKKAEADANVEVHHPKRGVLSATVSEDDVSEEALNTVMFGTVEPLAQLRHVWERAQMLERPLAVVFIHVDEHVDELKMFKEWAAEEEKQHLGELVFARVGPDFFDRIDMLGGSEENIPTVIITNLRQNWPYDHAAGDITPESLKEFAAAFRAGEIKPHFKSEPIPEPSDDALVQVVGHTFDEIVMDSERDVLLEFYAPWCGHCQALEPVYMELADEFAGRDDVVIARMDLTANDHTADVDVSGFPTIVLFPRGGATPITFEGGDRSLEALMAFVNDNIPSADPSEGEL